MYNYISNVDLLVNSFSKLPEEIDRMSLEQFRTYRTMVKENLMQFGLHHVFEGDNYSYIMDAIHRMNEYFRWFQKEICTQKTYIKKPPLHQYNAKFDPLTVGVLQSSAVAFSEALINQHKKTMLRQQ